MLPSIDDKKYYRDTRLFQDVVVQDGHFTNFETSPIMDGVKINEICIYGPNDVNKIGKIGRTSWDSFTYAIMMGHNVWMHVNAVQEANRQYDAGLYPNMLVASKIHNKLIRQYRLDTFKEIINEIFATSDKGKAESIVNEFESYWRAIPGTRGYTGDSTISARPMADQLFDFETNFEKDEPIADKKEIVLNPSLFDL